MEIIFSICLIIVPNKDYDSIVDLHKFYVA